MSITLPYGVAGELVFENLAEKLVADCSQPRLPRLVDPWQATQAALSRPINFPPLAEAVVPGDRVVIPIAEGIPSLPNLLGPAIEMLLSRGVSPSDITLLRSADDLAREPVPATSKLPDDIAGQLQTVVHLPEERKDLAYLAATEAGQRIYLNKVLVEADFILPVGCVRFDAGMGFLGTSGSIYPLYSDLATQQRYRNDQMEDLSGKLKNAFREEADEVGWLLGVMLVLQAVPGGNGQLLQVLAGTPGTILEAAQETLEKAWQPEVPRRAAVVIASITGGPAEQSWDNVGRALAAASRVVEPDGSIVLCCDVGVNAADRTLGPALKLVSHSTNTAAQNLSILMTKVRRQGFPDGPIAAQLLTAVNHARVFLLSQLATEQVESLDVAPLESPDHVLRLAARQGNCILLGHAQYALPTVAPE